MLCVQLWSVVRSQGKTMPTGGTLLIGREQDCEGGCFDSAPGELPAVLPLQTKCNRIQRNTSIGINHSVNMSMELCDTCVLIKHSLAEPERSDNIIVLTKPYLLCECTCAFSQPDLVLSDPTVFWVQLCLMHEVSFL